MDLKHVEHQRTQLLQFVLLLVMVFLGFVSYQSFTSQRAYLISSLAIVSLLACLFVLKKERHLKRLQAELIQTLIDEQAKSSSLESRLMEISALYRAISTVNSVAEPEWTFDAVIRAALDLAQGSRGSVMLLDEDSHLKIVSAHGLSDAVVNQTRQRLGHGVAGWVASNAEPVLLRGDARNDGRFVEIDDHDEELSCSISVPLQVRDEVLGVLNVGLSPDAEKQDFSEYDLRIVTVFAQHASVAIENARLRLAEMARPT